MFFSTIIAFTPLLLTPVIAFVVTSRHLYTTRIFTSLSYLLLLSNPLMRLFQSILQVIAAVTCFGRAEEFLETVPQINCRKVRKARNVASKNMAIPSNAAIVFGNGQSGWEEDKLVLNNIKLIVPILKLTMIVGPTASGLERHLLLKAIRGFTILRAFPWVPQT